MDTLSLVAFLSVYAIGYVSLVAAGLLLTEPRRIPTDPTPTTIPAPNRTARPMVRQGDL